MKPFIINARKNGKACLPFQVENPSDIAFNSTFINHKIVSCGIPVGHTYSCAWLFRVLFDNGYQIEFSSACTEIGNWQEIGSLNICISSKDAVSKLDSALFLENKIDDFEVAKVERLCYEDEHVYTECGLIFLSLDGREIWIAAAPASGAVSIKVPFAPAAFKPEFALDDYKRLLF